MLRYVEWIIFYCRAKKPFAINPRGDEESDCLCLIEARRDGRGWNRKMATFWRLTRPEFSRWFAA
jgi:hypothetical protein